MNDAPSESSWQQWLMDVAKVGLQAKWDSEYLEAFKSANQVPAQPVGATPAFMNAMPAAVQGASPIVLVGLAAGAGLLAWFALKG